MVVTPDSQAIRAEPSFVLLWAAAAESLARPYLDNQAVKDFAADSHVDALFNHDSSFTHNYFAGWRHPTQLASHALIFSGSALDHSATPHRKQSLFTTRESVGQLTGTLERVAMNENTPEGVAFKLLNLIAKAENKKLESTAIEADRKWILDLRAMPEGG